MNYQQMQYFKKVCDCGSFTKAASELFISPQGINKAIHQLEKEIGAPLFDQLNGALSLTSYGDMLYSEANQYLENHDRIRQRIEYIRIKEKSAIQICTTSGSLDTFPNDLIPRFMVSNPDIQISILTNAVSNCNFCPEKYPNSVWFSSHSAIPEGFTPIWQRENPLFLIVGPGHPFYERKQVSFTELRGQILINHPVGNTMDVLKKRFESFGVTPQFLLYPADRSLTMSLVKHNLAISFHAAQLYKQYPPIRRVDFSDFKQIFHQQILVPTHRLNESIIVRLIDYLNKELSVCSTP